MCSTVGASWYNVPQFGGVSAQSSAKALWKSMATDEERAKNGVKDVVKMVAFLCCFMLLKTLAHNHGKF